MKKLLPLVLTAIMCLCCLTACDMLQGILGKDKGITYENYENCAIFTLGDFVGATTIELDRVNLGEGAIYYQANLEEGALCVKYEDARLINKEQELAELNADDEMPVNSSGGYVEGDKIAIIFEAYSPVSGEIIIAFTEEALKAVHKDLHLHEHTWEWDIDEYSHSYGYTCGCPILPNAAAHVDGNDDGKCDVCEYIMGNSLVEPEYTFLHEYEGWLLELEADNVAEVKTTFEYVGVAPGRLKDIRRTTDKDIIANVIESYAFTTMTDITREEAQVDGGAAFTIELMLTDGTVKKLHFNNGNYSYGLYQDEISALCYFRLDSIPTLENYSSVAESYEFITYTDTGTVYSASHAAIPEQEPLCVIDGIGELEFAECVYSNENLATHTVETEFGTLVIYDSTVFYYNGTYYKVINDNFNFYEMLANNQNA